MDIQQTEFPGLIVIQSKVFQDSRGFFKETYQQQRYEEAGIREHFVQDNFSHSTAGILRGLHYQIERPQAKLVSVIQGEILDVCVDLRKSSPMFGKSFQIQLKAEDHRQLFVPVGFAHGFYVLSDEADFTYKCSDYYSPENERCLLWNDPALGIDWQITSEPILSEKDQRGLPLNESEIFETL